MKINEAFEELYKLKYIFDREIPKMAFELRIVENWDGPFREQYKKEVPGRNASKESGVYFIADIEETILYIGKAGANNLGAEIWGKFGAPNVDGKFIKSPLDLNGAPKNYRQIIIDGDILIAAAIISPKEHASLVEVYLHVLCVKNDSLPVLNKRIG